MRTLPLSFTLAALTPLAAQAQFVPSGVSPTLIVSQAQLGSNELTEGPVWVDDENGGYLLFSNMAGTNSAIWKWSPGQSGSAWASYSGKTNGNALTPEGDLITCEDAFKQVTRRTDLSNPGEIEIIVDEYDGSPLQNGPNDVVVKSDGTIWFTTPTWSGSAGEYVLRYDPDTETTVAALENTEFGRPNGLGFSPDENTFYLNDDERQEVLAFDVGTDNSLSNRRVFIDDLGGSADGMTVDDQGNLFICVFNGSNRGVNIYDSEGSYLDRIVPGTGNSTTNCAFGGEDGRTLFITSNSQVYSIDLARAYPPTPPEVEILTNDQGVRLRWPNRDQMSFQVQTSTDLQSWQNDGAPLSNGSSSLPLSHNVDTSGSSRFYRVIPQWDE